MSEIRERAKIAAKEMKLTGWDRWADVITDLQAELERVEKSLKVVQSHAKSAMDKLPERWNMGFQAGLKQAVPYENEIQEALRAERQGRKDDNVSFTEEILRLEAEKTALEQQVLHDGIAANRRIKRLVDRVNELEAENERMKADLSGSFFVEQIRQKAAMDCVEIITKETKPHPLFQGSFCNLVISAIKAHFAIKGE